MRVKLCDLRLLDRGQIVSGASHGDFCENERCLKVELLEVSVSQNTQQDQLYN